MNYVILEKSQVKGFTRTRKGKMERVNPFSRKGEKKVKSVVFLHGTTTAVLESILKHGLTAKAARMSVFIDTKQGFKRGVFLTSDRKTAEAFASTAWREKGTTSVVLEIKIPDGEKLYGDPPHSSRFHVGNIPASWIKAYSIQSSGRKWSRTLVKSKQEQIFFVPVVIVNTKEKENDK